MVIRDIGALVADVDGETGKETESLAANFMALKYACPVCNEVYYTEAEARKCRDQPYDNGGLKIGDIVVVPGAYHNRYELDDPWLAFEIPPDPKSKSHFDWAGYRVPYFVVTAIHGEHRNKHRCVVTLATLCGGELDVGWNPANGDGHKAMFRIDGHRCDANSTWIETIRELLEGCDPPESMRTEAAALAIIGISTRNLL